MRGLALSRDNIIMQNTDSKSYNSVSSTSAMIAWAMSGAAVLVLLPMLVGGFADHLKFSGKLLAYLAAADMIGAAIGTLIISPKVDTLNIKKMAAVAILIMVVGNLASIGVSTFMMLFIIRMFCGLGQGISMGAACSIMSHTNKADRTIALMVVGALLFGAAGIYIIPSILDHSGIDGLYISLAIIAFISLICVKWLPEKALVQIDNSATELNTNSEKQQPTHSNFYKWLPVVGVLFYFIAQGAIWAYIERMGAAVGFSAQDIGVALGICSIFGALGGGLAAFLDIRFGRFKPLTIAAIISISGLVILLTEFNLFYYGIAAAMFNFGWNYTYPYQLTAIRSIDPTARLVSVAVAMQTFGLAIGPVLAGLLIVDNNYDLAKWLAIFLISSALILLTPSSRFGDKLMVKV